MKSPKSVVLGLLQQGLKSDNLALAEKAFGSLSEEELEQKHGQSGKTCRQVLEECKKHYAEIENAIIWIKNI